VELQRAFERLAALAGEVVEAQLLSRGHDSVPLVELSGVLTLESSTAADEPRILRVGGNKIWIWPDRFVEANPIATGGALELVTQDAIVIVGPAGRDWLD
jgi:hypothetical protein